MTFGLIKQKLKKRLLDGLKSNAIIEEREMSDIVKEGRELVLKAQNARNESEWLSAAGKLVDLVDNDLLNQIERYKNLALDKTLEQHLYDQIEQSQDREKELREALLEAANILDGACDDEGNLCSNADAVEFRAIAGEEK
jgi:hypothetical protein